MIIYALIVNLILNKSIKTVYITQENIHMEFLEIYDILKQ